MKEAIRREILAKRRRLPREDILARSEKICKQLTDTEAFKVCRSALVYVSMPDEVQTRDIFRVGLQDGKTLVVPVVQKDNKALLLSLLSEAHVKELVSETTHFGHQTKNWSLTGFGIMEPRPDTIRPISVSEIDLIVVPGLAFDRTGRRIGYGGGYYDRLLEKSKDSTIAVAPAFDFQVLPEIPGDDHDQRVDMIITESGVINTGISRSQVQLGDETKTL